MKSYGPVGRRRVGYYTTNIWDGKKLLGQYEFCLFFVCHGEWERNGKTGFPPSYYLAYSNDYDEMKRLLDEYANDPLPLLEAHGKGSLSIGTTQTECGFTSIYINEDGTVRATGIESLGKCSDHLYD